MIREWADQDTLETIEMYLTPDARSLAATWSDEDAWAEFESALRDN